MHLRGSAHALRRICQIHLNYLMGLSVICKVSVRGLVYWYKLDLYHLLIESYQHTMVWVGVHARVYVCPCA